jgi:hypothetical protein
MDIAVKRACTKEARASLQCIGAYYAGQYTQ